MIRKVALTSVLLAVASAGAVTVKQLTTTPKLFGACRQNCSVAVSCSAAACFCDIPSGAVAGTCKLRPN